MSRRELWTMVSGLTTGGMAVIWATAYMDEAERCHEIAYIAYGKKLVDGPAADIPARIGLKTWRAEGPDLPAGARVRVVAIRGMTLQVVPA